MPSKARRAQSKGAAISRVQEQRTPLQPRRSQRLVSAQQNHHVDNVSGQNTVPTEQEAHHVTNRKRKRASGCVESIELARAVQPRLAAEHHDTAESQDAATFCREADHRPTYPQSIDTAASENTAWKASICHWTQGGSWPVTNQMVDDIHRFLPKRKVSLARSTSSSERLREEQIAPYKHAAYEQVLADKGSFMKASPHGVPEKVREICSALLQLRNDVPKETWFDDRWFLATMEDLRNRSETRLLADIGQLIAPSAEGLVRQGLLDLPVIDLHNDGWINCFPFAGTRPQPDRSVAFRYDAFSEDQKKRLAKYVGGLADMSLFRATHHAYFPFLTCEAKCGTGELDVADRQNAHSMTIAVRGVVELYRAVGRETEVDGEILAFSLSFDDNYVRMYGHYPKIDGDKTAFQRHSIRNVSYRDMDGKERWVPYSFVRNVLETWAPKHLERICSAVDGLDSNDLCSYEGSQSLRPSPLSRTETIDGEEEHINSPLTSVDTQPRAKRLRSNEASR